MSQEKVEVVRRVYELFNRRHNAAVWKLDAADAKFRFIGVVLSRNGPTRAEKRRIPAGVTAVAVVLIGLIAALVVSPVRRPGAAAFPGRNGKIAFESGRANNLDIYKMNPDGSRKRRLTHSPAQDIDPEFSANGKEIVFARRRANDADIYLMDADGSHKRRLTHSPHYELDPAFSPDGSQIAFSGDRADGLSDIFVMNVDGSDRRLLTHLPGNDWGATYSPDGTKIVFENTGGDIDVYLMNADGSHPHDLTDHRRDHFSFFPDFSPNGRKIVYTRTRDYIFQIYKMNADGSHQHALTHGRADVGTPAFSPNGKKIVFTRIGWGADSDVGKMNADGSHRHGLLAGPADDGHPDWGPRP